MSDYGGAGSDPGANYGTDANYQANYRLTTSFVDARKAPFQTNNRIWIGSYNLYQTDVADYDALLTSEGILHTTEPPQQMAHRWDSGWVPIALAALYQDSKNCHEQSWSAADRRDQGHLVSAPTVNGGLRIHLARPLATAIQRDPMARQYYGRPPLREVILLPEGAQAPARKYLDWHREKVFIAT